MTYTLTAEVRETKNPNELRRNGRVPGVVYGQDFHKEIAIPQQELDKLLGKITRSSRIALKINGEELQTFIKEIHYDPLNDQVLHIDLYRPTSGKPVKMSVPVKYTGDPVGKKKGGAVNRLRDTIQVIGPSDSIPELLAVDITPLDIGNSVRAGELKIPDGVQLSTAKEVMLVQIMVPRKIEEVAATPAEGEAAAEGAAATGVAGAAAPAGAAGAKAAPGKESAAPAGKAAPKAEEKKGK